MPRRNNSLNPYLPLPKKARRARKAVQIEEKKLGKHQAYGLAYVDEHKIVLDPRLKGKHKLEILLHELLHIAEPTMVEKDVLRISKVLANNAWRYGVRCVHVK
jgi:hypothetical protein